MSGSDHLRLLFVVWSLLFQTVLVIHFALRKWLFDLYILKYGWIVYALSLPAVAVSVLLLRGGATWSLWLGGFLYLLWAAYGLVVEYARGIQWRNPIRWSIFIPYVFLYLATLMFYWWPLALVSKPMWYGAALLFAVGLVLNATSHPGSDQGGQRA